MVDIDKTDAELKQASSVPDPVGYRMLVAPIKMEGKTKSGLYIPEDVIGRENIASIVAVVLKQGPDCYKDASRFPSGPWCKEGDFVILKSYSGTRIQVGEIEVRLINDDSIEAVVEDPRSVARAV